MIYKIADFYFDIQNISENTQEYLADYLCTDSAQTDAVIRVTDEDVEYEMAQSKIELSTALCRRECERLAVYRKVAAFALSRDAFLMHGAVIEYEGKGYMFTAKSGTGKTTHIRLWKKAFGKENVTFVNGDKPILRVQKDGIYAYGTPWCGKEGYNVNTSVRLHGLCIVERGAENSISRIPEERSLPRLFSQIMVTDSADLAKQLELMDALLLHVPVYELRCNIDVEAAHVAYEGMQV